jgi:hypothetical protein
MVEAWGAGAGGGSGRRGATSTVRTGGGGGGGGSYTQRVFKASELDATVEVTIGAGGSGGAAITADNTNGLNGGTGGTTLFGSFLFLSSFGGFGGESGSTVAVNGGTGAGVLGGNAPNSGANLAGQFGGGFALATAGLSGNPSGWGGASGGGSSIGGAGNSGGSSFQGGPAGGGGASLSSANSTSTPGAGGSIINAAGGGGAPAVVVGTNGGNGSGRQGGGGGASGSLTAASIGSLAFGNSTFAGVSGFGDIFTSANGTNNWVRQTNPDSTPIRWIVHNGSAFVVFDVSASRCWTTTDFVTYTEKTGAVFNNVNAVRFINSRYFVCAFNGIQTSTDLISWTTVSTGLTSTANSDITWTGTNYVVANLGFSAEIRYSSNLTTWSASTGFHPTVTAIGSDGAGNVVILTSVNNCAQRSTNNGVSFSDVATTFPTPFTFTTSTTRVAYLNSTWFAIGTNITNPNSLLTSTDGDTWTTRINATGDAMSGFALGGSIIAVGSTLVNANAARTASTSDLSTWTDRTITAVNVAAGSGGNGGQPGGGGGGGGASLNGNNSGAGGSGGNGLVRVYTW